MRGLKIRQKKAGRKEKMKIKERSSLDGQQFVAISCQAHQAPIKKIACTEMSG